MEKIFFHLIPTIQRDMFNWKCVNPVKVEEGEFQPELHEFLNKREPAFGGEK